MNSFWEKAVTDGQNDRKLETRTDKKNLMGTHKTQMDRRSFWIICVSRKKKIKKDFQNKINMYSIF